MALAWNRHAFHQPVNDVSGDEVLFPLTSQSFFGVPATEPVAFPGTSPGRPRWWQPVVWVGSSSSHPRINNVNRLGSQPWANIQFANIAGKNCPVAVETGPGQL